MTVASEEDKQENIFEQIERSRNRRSWNMLGLFRKSVTLVSVMVSTPLARTTGLVDTMKMAVTMSLCWFIFKEHFRKIIHPASKETFLSVPWRPCSGSSGQRSGWQWRPAVPVAPMQSTGLTVGEEGRGQQSAQDCHRDQAQPVNQPLGKTAVGQVKEREPAGDIGDQSHAGEKKEIVHEAQLLLLTQCLMK